MAQILSSRLGVPIDKIEIIEGDTDHVPLRHRHVRLALHRRRRLGADRAASKIIAKGKLIAAHLLEAAEADIIFDDGCSRERHRPPRVAPEVARAAYVPAQLSGSRPRARACRTSRSTIRQGFALSNGVHVCEVEIDPETGEIRIVGYWGVDDIGTVINPMIVDGQIHGGVAQGFGQAMLRARASTTRPTGSCSPDRSWTMRSRAPSDMPDMRVRIRREPALHAQSARRQGLRRGRHDRRARGHRRRRARCAAFRRGDGSSKCRSRRRGYGRP